MTNYSNLADRATILDAQIKSMTAELEAIKKTLKEEAGVGTYEGDVGVVVIRQNKDSEAFDAKKAFEYVSEHLSSQLLTAVKKKFTSVKKGAMVCAIDVKLANVA
jgi:hypothetical protein